ncbi:AI-2E family transporter [Haloplanus sp.]|uniref:AI-2E family transporter n=1 Tax=Haloplanus sp. TaxID=1961696 RepID=UPI00261C6F75|nr:AI-2E family transporter [Haloplanus sp.]
MAIERRYVLGAVFAFAAIGTAVLVADVLATVFFAVTVAYLLVPLHEELTRRGLSTWWASLTATAAAALAVVALALPLLLVVVGRLDELLSVLSALPPTLTIDRYGFSATVTLSEARTTVLGYGRRLARSVAVVVPVLALKLTVFVMLVFALLTRTADANRAAIAVVPQGYRDLARGLGRRTRATLFGIYVLQAATAVGTFAIAVVFFFLLGYPYFLTLAVVAAILQFVPVVGPSVLILVVGAGHVVAGDLTRAAMVLVAGLFLIAWLPDVLIRPRLARETADLPGSLYFVGFVGGLLTLGPVGIIAGPLAVALAVESAERLSAELNEASVGES